ncbi:MAG: hypothetical protein HYR76_10755 [Ignavibacteria bacterium]|nr:hypothetical protein [Ignavibacteria bacterium]
MSLILRTPLRLGTLAIVDCTFPLAVETGCIIAICHTPWARLLAEWCRVHDFALILAAGAWVQRTGHVNVPGGGLSGLRRLVRHLRTGGRAIVIADVFAGSRCCPVHFLGEDRIASTLPARLAAFAGVPLLAAVPQFQDGRVHLHGGIRLGVEVVRANQREVIQSLLTFFEGEIRRSPSVWGPYIHEPLNRMSAWAAQ